MWPYWLVLSNGLNISTIFVVTVPLHEIQLVILLVVSLKYIYIWYSYNCIYIPLYTTTTDNRELQII
ncbi:hypothetical protein EUTSA_v10022954mg [Eutrema salsugineum]|uniref:Uncharacterized protein n=1 Tax=Eutrema salsugineum TaxID=72664 RepID=V4M375_EUTSA|nr:hypothetical protein EUTSA_v10022954mg [Eutrema salsugineum]